MSYTRVKPGTPLMEGICAHDGGEAVELLRVMKELGGESDFTLVVLEKDQKPPKGWLYLRDGCPNGSRKFSLTIKEVDGVLLVHVPSSGVVRKRRPEYASHLLHIGRRGRGWHDRNGNKHAEPHA